MYPHPQLKSYYISSVEHGHVSLYSFKSTGDLSNKANLSLRFYIDT